MYKDWDTYENQRVTILQPLETLEEQYKSYKKVFDPKKGADWLDRKKKKAETLAQTVKEHYTSIKSSFANIVALAGEDKREFMEKEVNEIDERSTILQKVSFSLCTI